MSWPTLPFERLYAEPSRNGVYKSKEHHGHGTKIVNMGELFAYDVINGQDMKRLRMSETELDKAGLADGDLLFGRRSLVEAGAGKCSLVENLAEPTTFESSIIRVRVNADRVRPRFIFYWLKSHEGAGRIRAIVTGTNVKGIKGSVLRTIEVPCPPTTTQDSITKVLRSYDNLITNNTQRIKLLEDAARLLYEEWFVRLRFPGHEHTPIEDGIPKGWQGKPLVELAEINRLSLGKNHDGEIDYIDISCVTTGRINSTTSYEFRDAPSRARRVVQHGDIIWSCVRPNRQSHAVIWNPKDNVVASTGFAVITPKMLPTSLLYSMVTTAAFTGYLENRARGAAYPAVVAKDFEEAILTVPTQRLVTAYDEVVTPTIDQIHVLTQQNQKLQTARDLLLPRLMSGEVAV